MGGDLSTIHDEKQNDLFGDGRVELLLTDDLDIYWAPENFTVFWRKF